jgi:putative ABC transport system ATP-binding protein
LSVENIDLKLTRQMLFDLLSPERNFFYVAILYGIAISLLTLAVPVAVQTLINSVVNIASIRAIIVVASLLCLTLIISGGLSALRIRIMELFERRIYARLTAEFSLKTVFAHHRFFEGRGNTGVIQRYFDIMILQKNVPILFIDGFALVLQMAVGFLLVSFYHEALMLFNLAVIFCVYLIWTIWGQKAQTSAIKLSYAKYDTAKWLSSIASAHDFFKSIDHMDYAGRNTEHYIGEYLDKHKQHFKYTFAQTIMFLLLYAFASSSLLGLGGWLVVQGQLSIGQLVAAELILAAIFFGLSKFGSYLKLYYELVGAADKIGSALNMPQERIKDNQTTIPSNAELEANKLELKHLGESCKVSFKLDAGKILLVLTDRPWIQHQLIHLLRQNQPIRHGWMRLGGQDIEDYNVYELRKAITTIDRSLIVECSIKKYLLMAAPKASTAQMKTALKQAKLESRITLLEDGLDTTMSSLGNPLMPYEFLLLKLAAAFLAKPHLIILNQHFDSLPEHLRKHLLQQLNNLNFTVLYFTNEASNSDFGDILSLSDSLSIIQEGEAE